MSSDSLTLPPASRNRMSKLTAGPDGMRSGAKRAYLPSMVLRLPPRPNHKRKLQAEVHTSVRTQVHSKRVGRS
jgi:hypothetical protein